MYTFFNYLKIRLLTLSRNPSLDVLVIPIVIIFLFFKINIEYNLIYVLLLFSLLTFYLRNKTDFSLLKHFFNKKTYYILNISEGIIIVFFISIIGLANTNLSFYSLFLFIILSLIIIIINTIYHKDKKSNVIISGKLNMTNFEFISFFRQNKFYSLFIFICSLACFFHDLFCFVYIYFIIDFLTNVFSSNENKELLSVYFERISLKRKFLFILKNVVYIYIPVIVSSFINKIDFFIIIYSFFVIVLYILLFLSYKYSKYLNKEQKVNISNTELIVLLLLSSTIIGGVMYFLSLYKESLIKIKTYVNIK